MFLKVVGFLRPASADATEGRIKRCLTPFFLRWNAQLGKELHD